MNACNDCKYDKGKLINVGMDKRWRCIYSKTIKSWNWFERFFYERGWWSPSQCLFYVKNKKESLCILLWI